jgi:uncharacterized delta-60 repeat protein
MSFDLDGKLTTAIGSEGDVINSVRIQADGKIVAAGYSYIGSGGYIALARYDLDGTPDISFDGDGKLVIITDGPSFGYSTAIQSDGKIVVAGNSYYIDINNFGLARVNTDGSLDTGFSTDGKLTTTILSSHEYASALAVQSDGKIVVAGTSSSSNNEDFALARYNTNGTLDGSFSGDGKLTTAIGSSHDYARSIAIQADGKIVVAGSSIIGANHDFSLARYNANGSLDLSFDGDGKVTTNIGTSNDAAYSIAIQSDGKIVVAGYANISFNNDFALARYNADGSLDITFDGDGIVTTAIIGSSNDGVRSIAIQSDGKIVVAGYCNNGNMDFALARYNIDGSPDISFDGDGKLTTPIGSSMDYANSIAIHSNGKIIVGGYSFTGTDTDFALACYNTEGTLDASFDLDGKVTTAIGSLDDEISSIAIQNDGKIVAAGLSFNALSFNFDFALARYNLNGSLDPSFGVGGTTAFDLVPGSDESAYAMKLFSNRIYVGGMIVTENVGDFALISVVNDAFSLPLQLLDFAGILIANEAVLSWKTENEINTLEFIIERSTDGRNYNAVGSVPSANNTGIHLYTFTDPDVTSLNAEVVYYRLKQKDIDGRFTYSRIVALSIDNSRIIVLFYPNPVINDANLTITVNKAEQVQGRIIDNAGRVVRQQRWNLSAGSTSLSVDIKGLTKGIYYLELKGKIINERKQFVKL